MNRIKDLFLPPKAADLTTRGELRMMMPGMLIEQIAAVLLENINIAVMGFIGNEALAGVSQISTINNTLMVVFQFFAVGGTALVARSIGAEQKENAAKTAGAALVLGFSISLLVVLVLFSLRTEVIGLLFGSAEPTVLENSLQYFRWTVFAPPMWFLYFQCCGFMRSAGDTKRPMLASVLSNVLSMILNLVLTFKLNLGITGSAMAYTFSVMGCAVTALAMVLHKSFYVRPVFQLDRDMFGRMKQIAQISVPASVENFAFNGTKLVVQVFIAGMGTVVISANQVFNSASNLLLIPFMSINALTTPLMGRCVGRGGKASARGCLEFLYQEARFVAVWTGLAHLALAYPAALLFSRDGAVLRAAVQMLMLYALFALFMPGCFILPNGFKAVGDARYPMCFSSLSAWCIRVVGTWLLGVRLGWGTTAIVLTQGMDHIARCTAYRHRFSTERWVQFLEER
ncbi:MAG: MATE family efflux transporter [Clostridiales bacterium]|nr:MATE family efflux transporter [Clostridiales bacterium]